MKTTVNLYDFEQAFKSIRPDNFSYDGLKALFEYMEELEEETGHPEIELDVIAFCVDFSEYESIEEFQDDYGTDGFNDWDDVADHTTVIPVGDGAIVASF